MPGWNHFPKSAPWAVALCIALGLAAVAPRPALAGKIKAEAVTLDFQVTNSDIIARGVCEDAYTTFMSRNIFTTYKIRVKEYLKAPGKMTPQTDPVLTVSQLGGRLPGPVPVAQAYPEMATLYPGEKVVLFLRVPGNVPAYQRAKYQEALERKLIKPVPTMEHYTLTTLSVSKLNEVRDPRTGKTLIARVPFDQWGIFGSPEMMKEYVKAFEAGQGTIDVRQPRPMQVPVQLGEPIVQEATTMEQKIRQMTAWCSTLEDFQTQVQTVMKKNMTKAGASSNAEVQR